MDNHGPEVLRHVPRLNEVASCDCRKIDYERGPLVVRYQIKEHEAQHIAAIKTALASHAVAFVGLAPCGREVELRGLIYQDCSAATILILEDLSLCMAVPAPNGQVRVLGSDHEWITWAGGVPQLAQLLETMADREGGGFRLQLGNPLVIEAELVLAPLHDPPATAVN